MPNLTMNEAGLTIGTFFESVISGENASPEVLTDYQVLEFNKIKTKTEIKFSSWRHRQSIFSSNADEYTEQMSFLFFKYWDLFLVEVEKKRILIAETSTKKLEQSSSKDTNAVTIASEEDTAETINGTLLQTQRAYPNGYTGTTDSAYISAQVEDNENTQNTTGTRDKTDTSTATDTFTNSNTETDNVAKFEFLKYDLKIMSLISQFAFECLDNTIEGVF